MASQDLLAAAGVDEDLSVAMQHISAENLDERSHTVLDFDKRNCVECHSLRPLMQKHVYKCQHRCGKRFCSLVCRTSGQAKHDQMCIAFLAIKSKHECKNCFNMDQTRHLQKCSACGTRYCSKSCQISAWVRHKENCAGTHGANRKKMRTGPSPHDMPVLEPPTDDEVA